MSDGDDWCTHVLAEDLVPVAATTTYTHLYVNVAVVED